MAVYILTKDIVKKFDTSITAYRRDTDHDGEDCSNPYTTTKCGEGNCKHLSCAVFAAEWNINDRALSIAMMVIFIIPFFIAGMVLSELFSFPLFFVISLFIGALVIAKFKSMIDIELAQKFKDITEFSQKGTVGSIPSQQVYCVKLPRISSYLKAAMFLIPIALGFIYNSLNYPAMILYFITMVIAGWAGNKYYIKSGGYKENLVKYSLNPDCKRVRKKEQNTQSSPTRKDYPAPPGAGKEYFKLHYPPK